MTFKRSELREKCMIILYQIDIMKNNNIDFNIEDIIHSNIEVDNEFVKNIIFGVCTYTKELDELANTYLHDWTIDRLDKTSIAILRMSLYEYLYTDTPDIVIINEAIELAKKYSEDKVKDIINAVLDKVINNESKLC